MPGPKHSEMTDTQGLHLPKGFDLADDATAIIRNESGELEYRDLSELGATGPEGPAGTTLASVAVADIEDPDLSAQGGIQGDSLIVFEIVNAGVNKWRMYEFDTDIITASAPEIVTGDTGTWVLSQDHVTKGFVDAAIRDTTTSHIDGGNLTANADPAKYDIAAGTGIVVDSHTDPLNPTFTVVSWPEELGRTPSFIATDPFTIVTIDVTGAIIEKTEPVSSSDRRDIIIIGSLIHIDNVNITSIDDRFTGALAPVSQLTDFWDAVGPVNTSGNVYSANGANLNLNKSSGEVVGYAVSADNLKDPNRADTPGETALSWFYQYETSGVFTTNVSSVVDPNNYNDPTTGLATMPNNQFQIQRIFYLSTGSVTAIQYGQATYASLAGAEASLNTEEFNKNPDLGSIPLRGYLIVQEGATDLSNSAQAKFINGSKIDLGVAGGGASTSTTTLQGAYENGSEPEIETTVARGALTMAQGSGASVNLLEFEDSSAVSKGRIATNEWVAETQAYSAMNTLADAATILTDMEDGNVHEITMLANRTLGAPSNLADGATYIWIITQDVGGTNTLAYNAVFKFPGGTAPVLSTAGDSVDILTGVSDGTNVYCSLSKDFS